MRRKVVIWGMGEGYERILNGVHFEILKGNISVEAIIVRPQDKYCLKKDGFQIITKSELTAVNFDYIIVSATAFFNEICSEAMNLGYDRKIIINGDVFLLPLFDFSRYASLIENPVTILSDDCWSGQVYNRLKLPFSTPCINIYWNRVEFAKFIQDPLFYLNSELKLSPNSSGEMDFNRHKPPIGRLGDDGKYVDMVFVHSLTFDLAKQEWDRRKKRINENNLFVKMGFVNNKDYEEEIPNFLNVFNSINYKKILFYYGCEDDINGMFITNRMKKDFIGIAHYNEYCRENYQYDLDILKLLTGDEDYMRI